MASRQIKRSASARGLFSEATGAESPGRAASPRPHKGSPTMARNKGVPAVGGGVPAVPRRARMGPENVAPGDSPNGLKQAREGSPEVGKYRNAAMNESPEKELGGPLVETSSNRPSPSKRKLEFTAKASAADVKAAAEGADLAGQDDKGVRVLIRVRPMSKAEMVSQSEQGLVLDRDCSLIADGQTYTFDTVAGEQTTQAGMFEIAGRSAVENCLAGFNSSIFAYGQTGSGKTHTMTGQMDGSEARGLTPRVFEHMFHRITEEERANVDRELKFICKCSFLEIYNEHITDLLEPSSKNLQIREDKKSGIYVEGLLEEIIETVDDMQKLIAKGTANRTVAATNMNSASSRSHSVFTCTILSRNKNVSDGTVNVRRSRLNLVDLAGSERQKLTGAQGDRLKEASKINSSLSALGNVIKVLAEVAQTGRQRHVPYRDSRLTYLLQESLGGNAKTVMIANVSPSSSCLGETVSTLKFAQRAKAVQNKAVVNEETTNDVNVLRQQIRRLKDELLRMKTAPPPRSPSPASPDGHPTTPAAPATSDGLSSPSEAFSPEVMELTAKITELSQEALLAESFQGKLTDVLGTPNRSPEENITTRRRRQWADVARDVSEGSPLESPVPAASPSPIKIRPFPVSPEGFEVLADSPGRMRRRIPGGGTEDGTETESDDDEHSDKENSAGFQVTPGSEEVQQAYLHRLRFSTESDLPQCVESPESPLFGRDRRSKLRDPSQEKNLLLTPPFTPVQSLETGELEQGANRSPVSPAEVEQQLRAAVAAGDVSATKSDVSARDDDVVGARRSCQSESFFSSNDNVEEGLTSPRGVLPRGGARQSVESVEAPPREAADLLAEPEVPQTPVTPGFGKWQRWAKKTEGSPSGESTPVREPSGSQLSDASPSPKRCHVAAPESPASSPPPKRAHRAVTFPDDDPPTEAQQTAADVTPGSGDVSDPGLQMVVRVDRSVQGPSRTSLAGSVAELLLGPDAVGLSDVQLQAVEGVLAGALRREQVAEEQAAQLEGELEAMRRIVREYEHDYECNKRLVDCREDKIARLEQLADGVLAESEFLVRERAAAQLERRAMQEKIDRHPEVTRFAMENMRLVEQLRRYEDFYGCGEREALQKEVQQLRDHLLKALETGPVLTGPSSSPVRAIESQPSDALGTDPGPSDPRLASLEADVAYYKELAEVQRREAEEAKHTLGGAIVSNAKMASFFEEIQKENDRLLQKHRAIRLATAHMVSAATEQHGTDPESQWLQAHAAELAALRADDKENLREIDGLQAQLRDAREAVRAAGELTTRLHKAEERAQACEEVSGRTEQTVKELRRKAEQMRRQHALELAGAEKRVREARSKKGTVCQMCQMSERVVFHLPEGGDDSKPVQKVLHRSQTEPGRASGAKSSKKGFWFWGKGKSKEEPGEEEGSGNLESSPEERESMASNPPREEGTSGEVGTEIAEGARLDNSLESLPLTPR
ncbi:hypothetical protein KFL_003640100 [Klebsormidium nitens]|uniref:Kinesin motor domain-containing protein n=1 Tax=Klebsormidium nitens TaxID=105231 RepID=A0A1Y1IHJ1_KLENI|nr:hypothetical protein KFL_003640100 [Klebsormidium nitens]|eukprot:GAQ87608.1 hypothetical protein KFL_003640100 [Klebsormidium nitens]